MGQGGSVSRWRPVLRGLEPQGRQRLERERPRPTARERPLDVPLVRGQHLRGRNAHMFQVFTVIATTTTHKTQDDDDEWYGMRNIPMAPWWDLSPNAAWRRIDDFVSYGRVDV